MNDDKEIKRETPRPKTNGQWIWDNNPHKDRTDGSTKETNGLSR